MFDSYLGESILARAKKNKVIEFEFYNPRDFALASRSQAKAAKPYLRVDDKPFGGGPGMVIQAEVVAKAVDKAICSINRKSKNNNSKKKKRTLIIHLSPRGKEFNSKEAKKISSGYENIIIICGRYEGIDARIKRIHKGVEYSIGNFTLTGGELPAMVICDCLSRQIKGVLGDFSSLEEGRVSSGGFYTRPAVLKYKDKSYQVPKILLSGHHGQIEEWKDKRK